MNFYIKKGATSPTLKMELINDGRNSYGNFHDKLQTATITFCMTDVDTGVKIIGSKPALCILKEPVSGCVGEEYYIGYRFSSKETKKIGRYTGTFTIVFSDGIIETLIVPIKEELFINIM